jgi:hypothetical protein
VLLVGEFPLHPDGVSPPAVSSSSTENMLPDRYTFAFQFDAEVVHVAFTARYALTVVVLKDLRGFGVLPRVTDANDALVLGSSTGLAVPTFSA